MKISFANISRRDTCAAVPAMGAPYPDLANKPPGPFQRGFAEYSMGLRTRVASRMAP